MIESEDMKKATKKVTMEQLFRVLADRTRLRIINLLGDEEVCVCFLIEILNSPQPTISRHLGYLKRSGLVKSRREGKWMHYQLVPPADPYAAKVFQDIKNWLLNDTEMQGERKRLMKFCCAPKLPAHLEKAPRPVAIAVSA